MRLLRLPRLIWYLLKQTVLDFISDRCLSHGAAIAYYTVFSMAPVLVIVIAIAGLVFGHDAAQGAIVAQLGGLMGEDSARALQAMIRSASDRGSGILATALGLGTLILTASGVFGQMQVALNQIWKAEPKTSTVGRLVRARLTSLGLVATMGFLLMVSLVMSAAITALGAYFDRILPGLQIVMQVFGFLISFGLITVLFGAVYKILPDAPMGWRDVAVGAAGTALLFSVGKLGIGLYIGSSKVASSYGAAAAFVILLLWVYYSAQIFLLGAEFTKVFAQTVGSHAGTKAPAPGPAADPIAPAAPPPA